MAGTSRVALALLAIVAGTAFLFVYSASNGEFLSGTFPSGVSDNPPADPDAAPANPPQTATPVETALPENAIVSRSDMAKKDDGNPEPDADSQPLTKENQEIQSSIAQDSVQTTQTIIEDVVNSNQSEASRGENTTISERLAFSDYASAISLQPEGGIGKSSSFDGVLQKPLSQPEIDRSYPSLLDGQTITNEPARENQEDNEENSNEYNDVNMGDQVPVSTPESVPKAIIEEQQDKIVIPDFDEDLVAGDDDTMNDDKDLAPDDADQEDDAEALDKDNDGKKEQKEDRKDNKENDNSGKGNGEKGNNRGKGHDKRN